jgi:hypothetical protein
MTALLALAVACTPGGSDDAKSSSSGPVTLKLTANAVKGAKNATEATWLQDWVIPNFQKAMADQGKQVTVQYVGPGADDEDVKTQLALDLRTGAGPDVFTRDGWSQIPKPVAGIVEFEGKRYGIPVGTDGRCCSSTRSCSPRPACPPTGSPRAGTRSSMPAASCGPTAATAPSPSSPRARSPRCWRATTSGAASSTPTVGWALIPARQAAQGLRATPP